MPEPDHDRPDTLARRVLAHCDWAAGWNAQRLLDQGTVRLYRAGDVLSRRGEHPGRIDLILDGAVEVSLTVRSGRRHVLDFLGRGELVNLISVLDGSGAIHDTRAHFDTHVLAIGGALMQRTIEAEPTFNRAIVGLLCKRSRHIYGGLSGTPFASVRQRCARTLLRLANIFGEPCAEGTAIALTLSQEVLAEMVGSARPNVNRELKQLEREGLIHLSYQRFVVTDAEGLRLAVIQE
ncbi:CRP-like cAMP-activated global transcriptional regulator [Cupriavidus laharis]|uniref:CRP-like cAMP-activated global transcriptional regulator n=1 Tax=Cupriavidus laharis TaxID=151654 RepID=A0ABM8WNY0_9BURK|nr:Crp/Fnr family transcriptional regulator [Cupriavidus laharis]CAG9169130.1 CRP-like cAMP-activated global transcriptional regulator [Cupriavidus laharis]